ncbi:MAG: flavin reductase family protein [Actinoallomurus sp.]
MDVAELEPAAVYKLLVGSVVPRPIAWVASRSAAGVNNIAPFSFFNVACRWPPIVAISVGKPADPRKPAKDTLVCLQETGEFTVNIATTELMAQVTTTSVEFPAEVDEFAAAGLTPGDSEQVAVPRIAEAPISMECRVVQLIELGTDVLILGEVLLFHVRDDILDDRLRISPELLRPIGRMAGPTFCTELHPITVDLGTPLERSGSE